MNDSEYVEKTSCAACGSSDANAVYTDGHTHCFSCGKTVSGAGEKSTPAVSKGFLTGDFEAIPARNLDEATCRKLGYRVGRDKAGRSVQIADYRDARGTLVAQKIRGRDKAFSVVGDGKDMPLWGLHLWPVKGRRIVICEGEIDALSVLQACGLSWPVVSVPSGAQSAKKAIQRSLEHLSGYETVVLAFDMDAPGRAAAEECAELFEPGKCAVAELSRKDPNEMLVAGEVKQLASAMWNARVRSPAGIVNASEVWERITKRIAPGLDYPWEGLTRMSHGQQRGSLVTWTSGTGMGKSTAVSQVAYDLAFKQGLKVGYVALEEDVGRAAQRFLSCHLGRPTHLEGAVSLEEMRRAFDETLATGRVTLYDHFGSMDSENLIAKLRFMAKGCGCQALILDHLSIVVSGMDLADDERRGIDRTMTRLRTLVEETGVTMHLISHLRKSSDDAGFEEGSRVSLSQLRGSASIGQLSDLVIGLERNMQATDDGNTTVRILKNRLSGETGIACRLKYSLETGMLTEAHQSAAASGFKDETNADTHQDF